MHGADLLVEGTEKNGVKTLCPDPKETERSKLFANIYLATRVAFLDTLDSYAIAHNMDRR